MSGTFIIKPTGVSVLSGNWFAYNGASTFSTSPSDLLSAALNPAITNATLHTAGAFSILYGLDAGHGSIDPTNVTLRFLFSGIGCFFLDGSSTGIDFNNLPTGFTPTSLLASCRDANNGSDAIYHPFLQFDILSEASVYPLSFDISQRDAVIYPGATVPSIFDIMENGMGFRINNTTVGQQSSAQLIGIQLSGAYSIVGASVSNNPNNTTNPRVFQPGDTVSIVSVNPPDLTTVTSINIVDSGSNIVGSIPSSSFTVWTTLLLKFILPDLDLPAGLYTLSGVTFSGSTPLGSLYILIEDGSGIYRIVSGQTHDEYYVNSPVNNQTLDYKIPNPFIKTGYIGG